MSVFYSPTVGSPVVSSAPAGVSEADWHTEAIQDTGTSHVRVGRVCVIACTWCDDVFIAPTMGEALSMFRCHEEATRVTAMADDDERGFANCGLLEQACGGACGPGLCVVDEMAGV